VPKAIFGKLVIVDLHANKFWPLIIPDETQNSDLQFLSLQEKLNGHSREYWATDELEPSGPPRRELVFLGYAEAIFGFRNLNCLSYLLNFEPGAILHPSETWYLVVIFERNKSTGPIPRLDRLMATL
jgi:hypothetical protein